MLSSLVDLDRIVTKKGEESLLAVIYIDGNNMGAKVQACLKGKESYEECVTELRRFSGGMQQAMDVTFAFEG